MIRLCIITTVPETIRAFLGSAQLEFLQQNGFEITVLTSPKDEFGKPLLLPTGVNYETVPMTRTVKPLQDIKALIKICSILKKGKFDIVQYATPKASLFGSIGAWLARCPVRLYLMWGLYYVTQKGLKKHLFKVIDKLICCLSTDIAPDSKGNVQFAVAEGICKADKIQVIGHGSANGVDVKRFDPEKCAKYRNIIRDELKIPREAKVFGSIAAIVADKGINEMISAFVRLAEEYPDVYLLLIGRTTEKDPVTAATLNYVRNHKRIRNIGWQKEPEKYFAAMDIFVLPTYREGFGVVNIEASAMELPVISTDVPGPQESIVNGQTGILVPARTIEPLLAAMRKLVEDPDLARRLGKSGRQRVKDYFEQKQLWNAILQHKMALLRKSGQFHELDGEPIHRIR